MSPAGLAALQAAGIWTALHLLLLVTLSALVVRLRRRHLVGIGDRDVPELARAMRAFGNAAEYVPPALIGLALLALLQGAPLLVHAAGATLFAGRIAHAIGLSRSSGTSPGRLTGMVLTYLAYVGLAGGLLFSAL